MIYDGEMMYSNLEVVGVVVVGGGGGGGGGGGVEVWGVGWKCGGGGGSVGGGRGECVCVGGGVARSGNV